MKAFDKDDWTVGADGCCNSSEEYMRIVAAVEQVIRGSAAALINGRVHDVAREIVSRLAYEHGMRPSGDKQ